MSEKSNNLRFFISCFILSIGIWLFYYENGIVAQIPFICVVSVVAPFVYKNNRALTLYCAFFSFIIVSLMGKDAIYSLCFALVMIVFLLLGIGFVKCYNTKRMLSVVLAVLSVVLFTFLSGSFFGNIFAHIKNKEYIKNKGYDDLKIENTHFSFNERRYMTTVSFNDATDKLKAIICAGKPNIDGYREYIEQKFLDKVRYEASDILSQNVNFDFASRSVNIETSKVLSLDDDFNVYRDKMNFEIAFYSNVTTEQFEDMIKQCLTALKKQNFIFNNMTFFGGDTQSFLYQAKIPYEVNINDVKAYITSFDKNTFKNLNKERFNEERFGY